VKSAFPMVSYRSFHRVVERCQQAPFKQSVWVYNVE